MDIELLSLDRLPLPSLEVYALLSIIAASSSMYYLWMEAQSFNFHDPSASSAISDHQHNLALVSSIVNVTDAANQFAPSASSLLITDYASSNETLALAAASHDQNFFTWHNAIHWASQQPHCVWPLVNLAYCLLIVLSHIVQKSVFGNLRASEQENIKDQFWNLVFYKVVFVFGVVNVKEVEDAVGWCFFVSVIGFLQLGRQLCKDRHTYLILMNDGSPDAARRRRRIIGLLSFISLISVSIFVSVCVWYFKSSDCDLENSVERSESPIPAGYDFNLGLHSTIFMLCEIGLLTIQAFHALLVCSLAQIYVNYKNRSDALDKEHMSTSIVHAINYRLDLVALLFDLVHHVHMLVCCNLFLSMTSLIVSLQMRARVRQIHSVLKKRQSYMWLTEHIDKYPDYIIQQQASNDDDDETEDCAICWDEMANKKAKMLPCNHKFHAACLRKWLLVSMNCPTCRLSLINEEDIQKPTRGSRRYYTVTPVGVWGFLQTGQTLLDLFGGWDPEMDEPFVEEPSPARNVSLLGDFGVQDWTAHAQQPQTSRLRGEATSTESQKSDRNEAPASTPGSTESEDSTLVA